MNGTNRGRVPPIRDTVAAFLARMSKMSLPALIPCFFQQYIVEFFFLQPHRILLCQCAIVSSQYTSEIAPVFCSWCMFWWKKKVFTWVQSKRNRAPKGTRFGQRAKGILILIANRQPALHRHCATWMCEGHLQMHTSWCLLPAQLLILRKEQLLRSPVLKPSEKHTHSINLYSKRYLLSYWHYPNPEVSLLSTPWPSANRLPECSSRAQHCRRDNRDEHLRRPAGVLGVYCGEDLTGKLEMKSMSEQAVNTSYIKHKGSRNYRLQKHAESRSLTLPCHLSA